MAYKVHRSIKSNLLVRTGALALITASLCTAASAQTSEQMVEFDLPAQSLEDALRGYGLATNQQVMFATEIVDGKTAKPLSGMLTPSAALDQLLNGSGLIYETTASDVILVKAAYTASLQEGSQNEASFRVASLAQEGAVREINQQTDQEDEPAFEDDTIIVTGTNIRGVAPVGSPLIQFDQEAIAQTGRATLQEFFETVPQNFGGGFADDSVNAGDAASFDGNAGAGLNLRGLGNGSTLVLLNGNRLASTRAGAFVDVSLIPLSAVERIDILPDGASAIYGSDAISGVVNIILKDDFEGAETTLSYGSVTEGTQTTVRASQSFGRSWGDGRAFLTYDYLDQTSLNAEERDFTSVTGRPTSLIPTQERHTVFGSVFQDLTPNITVFGTALYSERASFIESTGSTGFTSSFDGDTQQLNLVGGLTAKLGDDWTSDLSISYSRMMTDRITTTPSALLVDFLDAEESLFLVDGKLGGRLFEVPGGDVRVALGGQFRRDKQENSNLRTVAGTALPQTDRSDERDVYAAFGEVLVPLIGDDNAQPLANRLELSFAARYEEYSDFGSSFDPKIGIAYEPSDGLVFRGSYGTSFRAPLLSQLQGDLSPSLALNSPIYFDPLSPTGFTPFIMRLGGNSDLGPETSTSWTIGTDFEPDAVPGLQVSATYFDIEFEDRIAPPTSGAQIVTILSNPSFEALITRDPDISLVNEFFADPNFVNPFGLTPDEIGAIADNRFQNLSATSVNGIDFSIDYGVATDIGQLNFRSSGSYYFEFENQVTETAPSNDILNTLFNPVDFTLRNSASWSDNGWAAVAAINYVDGYQRTTASPTEEISSWTTADVQVSYQTGDNAQWVLVQNTDISLNIQNLTDEEPPAVNISLGYDATNASPVGRFVSLQLRKKW